MKIDIIEVIHKKCLEAGLPVVGVASIPFRLDFEEGATKTQKKQALELAETILANKETELIEYKASAPIQITPEKITPIIDLLISKGLITREEINSL
jgi:hypothetical protein